MGELPITVLGKDDLPALLDLSVDREWMHEEVKWTRLLEIGEVYGIRDPDGGLAAAVVLTRSGPALACVGMMLVAKRFNRQGLGRRLMLHVLAENAGAVTVLHATPQGRPLYEAIGFRAVNTVTTHIGQFTVDSCDLTRPFTESDLKSLLRLDNEVVGADRSAWLPGFLDLAEQVRVIERDGEVTGYAMAWRNIDTDTIGPVVAASLDEARQLIVDLAAGTDLPVRLDLDREDLANWVAAQGLPENFRVSYMVHGGELPGDRARLFTPAMQAVG